MQKAKLLLLGTCLTLGMAATAQKIAIQLPASEAGVTSLAAQQYSVAISDAKGDISLKFSTISSSADKQRAYLDEFKVVKNTNTAISAISAEKTTAATYDLLRRSVKNGSKGICIVNGKKVIRYFFNIYSTFASR